MPRYTVDLHNHTPLATTDYRGDPATTPRQIVERALEAGIDVLGITDHFSVEYAPRMVAAAEEVFRETSRRLLVVPGAELRVCHEGEEVHLVCLFEPREATSRFSALLDSLGLVPPVATFDEIQYFRIEHDPLEVARLAAAAGALCFVGHVDRSFGEYRFIDSALVHDLIESEHISAIEFIDRASRAHFRNGLAIAHIASSDSHSLDEMGRRTAVLDMPELSFKGLQAALVAARHAG